MPKPKPTPRMNGVRVPAIIPAIGLCAFLLSGCGDHGVGPQENVVGPSFLINAEPDFTHDNVGALVSLHPFIPGNPLAPMCTGTLIAPSVVVTAGHCAFIIAVLGLPAWFAFDQQFNEASPLIPATAVPHPSFTPSQNPNDLSGIGGDPFEIGVLLLEDPVTDRSPATLPAEGLLDDLKRQKMLRSGDPFTVVGYGAIGFTDGVPVFDGQRRSATVGFKSLNGEAVTLGTPHDAAHACFGDSGGPNFLEVDGDDVLTSVTWWIGAGPLGSGPNVFALNCTSWHRAYRLDIPQARSFLGEFVALP